MTDAVWIKNEPDENGHYQVYLELGEDDVVPLTADDAYRWPREVLSAVAAAEYDAAILRQASALTNDEAAAEFITELRADRAVHIPVGAIPGLALIPGVAASTRKAFLRLDRYGETVGQWEPDDARQHALALIEAFEVSLLDGAYLRLLQRIGIDRPTALQVVSDLAHHREEVTHP